MQRFPLWFRYICIQLIWIAGSYASDNGTDAEIQITPVDTRQFCADPDKPASLQWRIEGMTPGGQLEYRITSYTGAEVEVGEVRVDGEGLLTMQPVLPQGYYEISFPQAKTTHGLILLPAVTTEDTFFAIDTAISQVGRLTRGLEQRAAMIDLLHRQGISMARERFYFPSQHNPDEWDLDSGETGQYFASTRQLYANAGVPVLEMYHNVPGWLRAAGSCYPGDLNIAVTHLHKIWNTFGKHSWGAFEIWNEPDIFFGKDLPGDHYLSYVKAVAHAYPDNIPLVGGVLASAGNWIFMNSCVENGLMDYVDAVSFHTYGPPASIIPQMQSMRDWVAAGGRPGLPIWLTEAGRPWTTGTDRPNLPECMISARAITMQAIMARACGVEKFFAFLYVFYGEPGKNYGMNCKHNTPLRSLAAYFFAAQALANSEYVGDLPQEDNSVVAKVFRRGDDAIVVYDTGGIQQNKDILLAEGSVAAYGIDGRSLIPSAGNILEIDGGMAYVWHKFAAIADKLDTETPDMQLYRAASLPAGERKRSPDVILQPMVTEAPNAPQITKTGYYWHIGALHNGQLSLRAHNMRDTQIKFRLRVSVPEEFSGGEPVQEKEITISANSHADTLWSISFAANARLLQTFDIVADALTIDGEMIDRAVFKSQLLNDDLSAIVDSVSEAVRLPVLPVDLWAASVASGAEGRIIPLADGVIRLEAEFAPKGTNWMMPHYPLPEGLKLKPGWTLMLRARAEPGSRLSVFFVERGRARFYTPARIMPDDGEWHIVCVQKQQLAMFPDDNSKVVNEGLDESDVIRLEIGFTGGKNTGSESGRRGWLEISDIFLLNW